MIPLLLLLAAPIVCEQPAATDGDTIRCGDGLRIRLSGIDAPELHGCHGRPGRICVPGDGNASREALRSLVQGQTLRCVSTGTSYRRVTAWCYSGRVDVSCRMVAIGAAQRWQKYWRNHECPR